MDWIRYENMIELIQIKYYTREDKLKDNEDRTSYINKDLGCSSAGKFMLYSMGKCYSNDQDRISTVTSRYDKYSQSDRICRNKICVSRAFCLDFCFYTGKESDIARWKDSKICSSCLPCADCWTVFFLLYRRGTYIWSERWNHYRFRKFYRNPNVMFDCTK